MKRSKKQLRAATALNLDLFRPDSVQLPAPATLHTRIREYAEPSAEAAQRHDQALEVHSETKLPSEEELARLFERYN